MSFLSTARGVSIAMVLFENLLMEEGVPK